MGKTLQAAHAEQSTATTTKKLVTKTGQPRKKGGAAAAPAAKRKGVRPGKGARRSWSVASETRLRNLMHRSNLLRTTADTLMLVHDGKVVTRRAAHLFNALGREPNTAGLDLHAAHLRDHHPPGLGTHQQRAVPGRSHEAHALGEIGHHEEIGRAMAETGVAKLYLRGEFAKSVARGAVRRGV